MKVVSLLSLSLHVPNSDGRVLSLRNLMDEGSTEGSVGTKSGDVRSKTNYIRYARSKHTGVGASTGNGYWWCADLELKKRSAGMYHSWAYGSGLLRLRM